MAQAWHEVRDWLASLARHIWGSPTLLTLAVFASAAYFLALVFTAQERSGADPAPATATATSPRRVLIAAMRDLAVNYANGDQEVGFRRHLEANRKYADIRKYLSADFLAALHKQRTLFVPPDGARYPVLVALFLDELDRIEREWHLD